MELTITDVKYLHGRCKDTKCPVCKWWEPKGGQSPKSMAWNKNRVTPWLAERLTLLPCNAKFDSPWWLVEEDREKCKAILSSK